tara:strand:+ start:65 stop:646 length:582 start_codon:yes stop_codon:yes gene_type:complete
MSFAEIFNSDWFRLVFIPLFIVLARIVDVSLGTLRIIFVSKGMKYLAPALGFVEVIIWLLAIGQIMQNLSNVVNYIAYGLGFAIGNYLGIRIEEKLAMGFVVLRVITRKSAQELKSYFTRSGYKYTILDAMSDEGPVHVIYITVKRKNLREMIPNVKRYNPKAFYTVEDLKCVSGNVLSQRRKSNGFKIIMRK